MLQRERKWGKGKVRKGKESDDDRQGDSQQEQEEEDQENHAEEIGDSHEDKESSVPVRR